MTGENILCACSKYYFNTQVWAECWRIFLAMLRNTWRISMKQKTAFVFSIIGVLVFASKIKAQEPLGTPGVDYPNYFTIPETSFKCSEQKYNPGFYADVETKCQAFHFCYQDRQESFLCPTGTIFNQAVLTCDVWHKSNCSLSQMFYSVNSGPVMERAGKNLPMLLRLRNRSQSKPSIQTSTSSVFDKVSSLYDIDNESSVEADSQDFKAEASDKPDTSLEDSDKEQMLSNLYTKQDSEEDGREETNSELTNEDVEEEMDMNLVYDSADEGYYRNYDQSEGDWQDSEQTGDEFGSFYGYDRNYQDYESKSTLNDVENESLEDSDLTVVDDLEYPEFTKRNSQVGHSRVRRKPVYLVFDDQPVVESELTEAVDNIEYSSILSNSETREGKELNITSEESVNETTPKPEPFPRPTPLPRHELEELSTSNPMTSDEFGEAIIRELVLPRNYRQVASEDAVLDPNTGVWVPASMASTRTSDTQSDDESIYIQNDLEPETYAQFSTQYEDVAVPVLDESYEESYEDSKVQDSSSTDTYVVIPDEYDNVGSVSNEGLEMDYTEETGYRAQMLEDTEPEGYGTYENYQYSSNVGYPEHYEQSISYPEVTSGIYQNVMPSDQRYSYNYQYPGQMPVNYASSSFDTENAYTYTEQRPYENEFEVTERPLPLPVTEFDLNTISVEDFGEIEVQDLPEPDQNEDVYYILDLDEEQSSIVNETEGNEKDENEIFAESTKFDQVDNQSKGHDQTNSSADQSTLSNQYLDTSSHESPETENSAWSSNSETTSQKEPIELIPDSEISENMNSLNTQSDSNLDHIGQFATPVHESLSPVISQSYPSNLDSFDFSTDSRLLKNMGYSESMDFGPYGFGPNMGQQFSMMEPIQQSTIGNPFSQRMGQSEQPKFSTLSAIQEKMRSMKQGKFGAFKKYISSQRK